jgi:DNA-binding GntR family transcriptional regulator
MQDGEVRRDPRDGTTQATRGGETRMHAAERVADEILSLIGSERLDVGTHLSTERLALRFGVSRWPVEQALKALAGRGIVIHRPRRGFFVGSELGNVVDASVRPNAVQVAYLALAADLIAGRIERQLSESFVRDRYELTRAQAAALFSRLSQEGLAERRSGYGWNFSEILTTPEALEHSYELRLMIEPAALLLEGYRLPGEEIERLRRIENELLAGAIERLSPDALFDYTARFHEDVIAGARNPFLVETLRRVNRVRRLLIYQSMKDRDRYFRQSREHLQILAHIELGRADEASRLMRAHLEGVMTQLHRIGILGRQAEAGRTG